uniref:Interleukin n=1 Tax=Cynoglossus semilaevis TaxID=244447 RepID=A0A3P8UUY7_CYNSE
MEHFTRISILIFTFFGCFQAAPYTDSKMYYLQRDVSCPPGSTFYAPTNVKVRTILCYLCVLRELNGTVTAECDNSNGYVGDTMEFLEERIEPPKSSECECERWQLTPFDVFLNKMESLLQMENAAKSGDFNVMAS